MIKLEIKDFLVDEEIDIIEAMKCLEGVGRKILFVTHNNKLVATLTDGDIRRWILKKGSLSCKIKEVANYNPKFINENERYLLKEIMKKNKIEAIPIVDEDKNVISIIFSNSKEVRYEKKLDIPVVIMAGGFGTRLHPYTKILPKPLIPIGEIPIIEHIINKFNYFGCCQFFLIVNHKKNMIKAYFSDVVKKYEINYIDETIPLGTGGGLTFLKGIIDRTFILSNCDILIEEDFKKIYKFHKEENNLITMVCSLKHIKIPYGVIDINEKGKIEMMKEKPEMSFLTNTGVYIIEPEVIDSIEENISIGFPDIIEKYRKEHNNRIGIFPISENNWMDMGELEGMEIMRKRLSETS